MGDIGSRQVRYEVLPTASPAEPTRVECVESRVDTPPVLADTAPHDRDRSAARAEPARG